jgi:AraC family transcriptional regulator of adaptative response / DNA-3-methyladenine glycosylase II
MENTDYYQALLARDAKFDGKFFFGVKTTGVYCRPICPARPKRENVEFFDSALQAEKSGYRPCLRCRPESAPDSPLWQGSNTVVRRAIKVLLNDVTGQSFNEQQFAACFALSARQLRRLFQQEFGKTPAQIMRDNRLNLARKLIVETDMAQADVAYSAGFDSVRRFNDAIRNRFSQTPSQLRKHRQTRSANKAIQFSLAYRPPLDWQACLDFYQKHRIGELEQFGRNGYQRWFQFEGQLGLLEVTNNPSRHRLEVSVTTDNVRAVGMVINRVKQLFDLSLDPVYLAAAFDAQPQLAHFYRPYHGTRLARCWDPFELAISAILGQLVSIKRATQLLAELLAAYGTPVVNPINGQSLQLFPSPRRLASETLQQLKVPKTKKTAIIQLSQQVASDEQFFSSFQDVGEFKQRLLAIHGIGPWTANYIALRAIGDSDAFPPGDVFLNKQVDANNIEGLSPWRGYLATLLYKHGAQPQGATA